MLGSIRDPVPILISALGSSTPIPRIPLGLWYLKDLPTTLILFDKSALAKVSPMKAEYFLPSKVKLIFLCDVIGWLGILLGFVFIITYFKDFISA